MIAAAKAIVLALVAVGGVGAAGVVAGDVHLQNAIDIHKNHLSENSTMPDQCEKGQQNALDHLLENQEKWLARNITQDHDDDLNDTDDYELED